MRKSTTIIRLLPILLLAASFGTVVMAAGGRKGDATEVSRRRAAARHYYLTAAQYSAIGHNAEAGELYKKAWQLDSTYAEAALQYGVRRWGMPSDTLSTPIERERSKRIAKKFIAAYPGDFFPNIFLSNVMERGNELEESVAVLEQLHDYDPGNTDVLQHLAMLYLDTRDFDKALETINAYERIEGDDIELTIRKTGMLLAMGDTVGALAEADRMLTKYPADTRYAIFKGQLFNYIDRPDSALVALKYAESLEKPGYGGSVKLQLADYYREQGDSVNYDAKVYEALLCEDLDFEIKNDVMAYYLQGLFTDNSDRTRGDKLFEVLRSQYPHEPALLSLSARYNAAKGDFSKALEDIGYALDLEHTNPDYWEQAMLYALMLDDYRQADSLFARAREALVKTPMRLYSLAGSNAVMEKDYDRALDYYQTAIDENFPGQTLSMPADMQQLGIFLTAQNIPDLINLYQQAGDAYYKKGMKREAFVNYDNSLTLEPDNPLTLNNYAYFLIEGNAPVDEADIAKADDMSMRAVTLMPDNPTYLDTRAWLLFRKGDFQEARETEERAIKLLGEDADKEENAEYLSHLGDILFMLNEPQQAVEEWKKALVLSPDDELLKKKVQHRTFFYE
ncbi:MAG: tetratricopeptide repeat protein [Muribaculaceae bacterium]|nr:tetratricopeptide repeat protein [Muribaculaceae bacterium]